MKKLWMLGVAMLLAAQAGMADPSAANRIAANKTYKPLAQAEFLQQYAEVAGKQASAADYKKYLKRWKGAKADGWLMDVRTFAETEG
ncbi:hypothetical protein ACFPAG_11930 [Vogesella sp. GCM10023246]|uniref:Uncharacterized protein n=1 Tax=Vogesella oryzagri TaxID=3160864 RepID=A0ABV1M8M4_9NEIS